MTNALDELRLRRLVEAGAHLTEELDLEAVLVRVLEVARDLTGAAYAALGVLDEHERELERFITLGIDDAGRARIGDLPRGRGVLGLLIDDPRPLRLHDVSDHPQSYGFPPGHPPMRSFLGVPVTVRGKPYGDLYLTEKQGGDFDDADEEAVTVLAEWAAVAIDNARLYTSAETRRVELERAVRGLEATVAISRALGGETDLARVLELIVKRARALVEARALVILLCKEDELVVAATAGELKAGQRGQRAPLKGSVAEQVIETRSAARVSDAGGTGRLAVTLGLDADAALVAPLEFRGRILGVLQAYDRMSEGPEFTRDDEVLLASFAASAATAVATAQSVERGRLEHTVEAAEQERRRWARELHDDTLQVLGAVRMMLTSAGRERDPEVMDRAADTLQQAIEGLRAIITELRPAALDELGLAPALESLVEQMSATHEVDVELAADLDYEQGRNDRRLAPELESTAYRIVQEALNNALRHADPHQVAVEVSDSDGELSVVVRDDGRGFDTTERRTGFGLLGMQERTELVDGVVTVESRPGAGTTVVATFPARRARAGVPGRA